MKKLALILMSALPLLGNAAGFRKSGRTISFEKVRIEILSPTMFSLKTGDGYSFSDVPLDLGVVARPSLPVRFDISESSGIYEIRTDSVVVRYDPSMNLTDGGISVSTRYGGVGCLSKLDEPDTLNLGGVIGALDNCDGTKCYSEQNDITSPFRERAVPMDGIISRRGYTVLKHTKDALNQYKKGDAFDELYVMCYGSDYRRAFADFYSIAGKPAMLPKWSLGLIYSRWKDYTDSDYKKIVSQFRSYGIPLDAIILDMCWHVDNWYGYKYDTHNFPDMKGFLDWTESEQLKVGFNHHSGCIFKDDPKIMQFCRKAGIDYESAITDGPSFEPDKKVVKYDTKNERHFKAFYDIYLADMIKDGFDFHWVDGDNSIYSAELYDRFLREETGKRPFVLNRQQEYTLCNHRYPAAFSGDTYATWATMRNTLETTIKGGNNGVNWSHDIGGYMPQGPDGYIPDGEMFARWAQLGAFSPLFRLHAKKDLFWYPAVKHDGDWDGGSRLPWEWGETVLGSIRQSIRTRARLIPYIYTLMREEHETGVPICRGMYIDYPSDDEAYVYDQYMFGGSFLVAPLMRSSGNGQHGISSRKLWLPSGTWYDYFTNKRVEGGRSVVWTSGINTFPLFVKAGSIIPSTNVKLNVSEPLDTLVLTVYAPDGASHSTFDLYEDQGDNLDFGKGRYRTTLIEYDYDGVNDYRLVVNVPKGSYEGQEDSRSYRFVIVNAEKPQAVFVGREECDTWEWENGILSVETDNRPVSSKLIVNVK